MTSAQLKPSAVPAERVQSMANHRAFDLRFMLAGAILAGEFVRRIVAAVRAPDGEAIWAVVVGVALLLVWHMSRAKALKVQDRVIRLEMRVRLARLLPANEHGDIDRLSLSQLIALRFAGDAELPALVRTVLAEGITARSDIKGRITHWRADWLRV